MKYAQVVEQFDVEQLVPASVQTVMMMPVEKLVAPLVASHLLVTDDSGAPILNRVSFEIQPNETVAVLGPNGAGGEAFADAFGRVVWPDSGKITLGGQDILELPESVTGRRISFASSDAYFFQGSLRDNLFYGLKHAPLTEIKYKGSEAREFKRNLLEAQRAGNPALDLNSDWIDYKAAGAEGPDDLLKVIRPVLDAVMISQDIFDLALRSKVDVTAHPAMIEGIVEVRAALRRRLAEEDLDGIVVPFEPDSYNEQATVGENLLFGTMKQSMLTPATLAAHPYFRQTMRETGLSTELYAMGLEIAETAVELFRDLPPDNPFFQQLTFMSAEDIPAYEELLQSLKGTTAEDASSKDRINIIRLSFAYIEPRHRFGLLTPELREKIVAARQSFYADMPEDLAEMIERHDPERFSESASLIDNVLFGRIAYSEADASDRIKRIARDIFAEMDLEHNVLSVGLDFDVGTQGRRLTNVQRQKLNLARALLKKSDFFIFNRPLPALDQRAQDKIVTNVMRDLHKEGDRPAIVWVLPNADIAQLFDRILVFKAGNLVENGSYDELFEKNGMFKQLVS